MTSMLILVVVAALAFDYVNGWNDSANAIATVVSTRVLSPYTAVIFAAILNFVGALVSDRVAKTIGQGLVAPDMITPRVVLAAMIAAAFWVAFCTLRGLPISGSHSLIGGLIGAAVASSPAGWDVVHWNGLKSVLIAMLASPLFGFLISYLLLAVVYWIAYCMSRNNVRRTFSMLQIFSSGCMAFAHGMNDAQKVMGVITLALYSAGQISTNTVPTWVKLTCAFVMGLGTAVGGWKVIKTLGMNLAHIGPVEGFAAEAGASAVLAVAAFLGVPVSTTHTITGAIMGVGAVKGAKTVKWSVGKKILYAWIFTVPVAASLGGLLAWLIR